MGCGHRGGEIMGRNGAIESKGGNVPGGICPELRNQLMARHVHREWEGTELA